MKKEFSDYDLDVMNALTYFPEDDNNCYLYIRGKYDTNNGFMLAKGTSGMLSYTIGNLCLTNIDFFTAISTGIIVGMKHDKKLYEIFEKTLKNS